MIREKKHRKKTAKGVAYDERANHKRPIHIGFVEVSLAASGFLVVLGTILQMSSSHKLKIGAVWIFVAAAIIGAVAIGVRVTREIEQPEPEPLPVKQSRAPEPPGEGPLRLTSKPTLPKSRFSDIPGNNVRVIVGSNTIILSKGESPRSIPLVEGLEAQFLDGKLVVNAPIFDGTIRLSGDQLAGLPPGWDWNSDESAIEVVDGKKNVVFQLEYPTQDSAIIRGVFVNEAKQICSIVTDEKVVFETRPDMRAFTREHPIPILFKYPSFLHRGERR